jgi:hypothetical protein
MVELCSKTLFRFSMFTGESVTIKKKVFLAPCNWIFGAVVNYDYSWGSPFNSILYPFMSVSEPFITLNAGVRTCYILVWWYQRVSIGHPLRMSVSEPVISCYNLFGCQNMSYPYIRMTDPVTSFYMGASICYIPIWGV